MNCLTSNSEIVLSTAMGPSMTLREQERRGTSLLGTVFLIINSTLGAGLLNFPQAFDKSGGIATAIIIQFAFLVIITATLIILANCSNITNTVTVQNVLAELCGAKYLTLCSLCVIIYSFGCCITFLIIIGDQFDRVFATFYGANFCHYWYLSRPFVISLTCVAFILPLCFFKRLDMLSSTSCLGCGTIVYVTTLIIYQYFALDNTPKSMKIWPEMGTEALQIVPIICFAYQSHMTAIPTYSCMKNRQVGRFGVCAIISMIICFLVYSVVGIFGYATFGIGKVPSDILQGYTDKSAVLTIAIISVAIKNFTTYPIVLLCGREALFGLIKRDTDANNTARILFTVLWFFSSLVIAILVPDIAPVISLLGCLSAAFIFLFPGICLFQSTLLKDPELFLNKDKLLIGISIFIIALGAFVCGVVLMEAFNDLSSTPSKPRLITGFRINLKESLCI
ncbi:putative sodium-coupled neutral amino acid transporter 7 [Orussus abietinus]|uniref:putative sodium-coupled neutral amino acid transporter 7 n=1 Tax=Orussus abietinus TaxID=222816 RepID=UPI00062582FB|nr:putative sodium-coupled neutral amino acid transporter 7 [Orussus abietinus]